VTLAGTLVGTRNTEKANDLDTVPYLAVAELIALTLRLSFKVFR
jgi:hypothetical protein